MDTGKETAGRHPLYYFDQLWKDLSKPDMENKLHKIDGEPGYWGAVGMRMVNIFREDIKLFNHRREQLHAERIQSFGDPFYDTLEGFVDFCEGGARLAYVELNSGDKIVYVYDYRPQEELLVFPDGTPIDEESRGYFKGGNMGVGWNINGFGTEWGTNEFLPRYGESHREQIDRHADGFKKMLELIGCSEEEVFIVAVDSQFATVIEGE